MEIRDWRFELVRIIIRGVGQSVRKAINLEDDHESISGFIFRGDGQGEEDCFGPAVTSE